MKKKTNWSEVIENAIKNHDIVLFMKGTVDQPQCGFSYHVLNILNHYSLDFLDVNVLSDDELREEIKKFSDWPTIPQLYIKGEFIGGCDIVKTIEETGELKDLLLKHKLIKVEAN
jgi:monothiol glutaredoxin